MILNRLHTEFRIGMFFSNIMSGLRSGDAVALPDCIFVVTVFCCVGILRQLLTFAARGDTMSADTAGVTAVCFLLLG